jgi:hypothetical protein
MVLEREKRVFGPVEKAIGEARDRRRLAIVTDREPNALFASPSHRA